MIAQRCAIYGVEKMKRSREVGASVSAGVREYLRYASILPLAKKEGQKLQRPLSEPMT